MIKIREIDETGQAVNVLESSHATRRRWDAASNKALKMGADYVRQVGNSTWIVAHRMPTSEAAMFIAWLAENGYECREEGWSSDGTNTCNVLFCC